MSDSTSSKPPQSFRESQATFFDHNPPLYPWPHLLRRKGLARQYKPREVFWASALRGLLPNDGAQILDVGCGTGVWLDRLSAEFGTQGVGIDVSWDSVRSGASGTSKGSRFVCGDVADLPFADKAFDMVISLDVLEHVQDQGACLQEMSRLVKPGGMLFLWSINRRQRFTWNWCLAKLGVDIYDRVAHDPTLMPEPHHVAKQLLLEGLMLERLELFNSFFTLALDEAIMMTVKLFEIGGFLRRPGKYRDAVGKLFLAACHAFATSLTPVLNWLDRPWMQRGYSNGFLVVARRPGALPAPAFDEADTIRMATRTEAELPEAETVGVAHG